MHSSRSYYPPDPYAVHQQHSQTVPGQYGNVYSSQHNHPTYYPDQVGGSSHAAQSSSSYYDSTQYSQPHAGSSVQASFHHQHHAEPIYGSNTHPHQTSASNYYSGSNAQQDLNATYSTSLQQTGAGQSNSLLPPPPPPPPNAQQSSIKTKPSPFGATGPYGIDAQNSSLDYYRRLYYPYDPITGEYMKDATPPGAGDTGSSFAIAPDGVSSSRPYTSSAGHGVYSQCPMTDNINGRWSSGLNINSNSSSGAGAGAGAGQMMMMNAATAAAAAAASGGAHFNPYMIRPYQENDSLLLCCDFLIPRPSINCLIIALFTMLVLIVIFTVVKFTIIYPAVDKSYQETLILVDQITVILLLCALAALIWIFGIYFTSRRTRRQISSLLSCTSASPSQTLSSNYSRRLMRAGYLPSSMVGYSSGSGDAYQTALVNDTIQYNQYSNSRNSRNYDSTYSNRSAHYPNYV